MPVDSMRSGGLVYRMEQLEKAVAHLSDQVEEQGKILTRLEPVSEEIKNLRKAANWVAGLIVAGAIGFAFSVLTVFGA